MLRWFSPMTTTDTRWSPYGCEPGRVGSAGWREARRSSLASSRRPARTRSSIPESRAVRQSAADGSTGPSRAARRGPRRAARPACRTPAPTCSASRSRSHEASAGLCPPVDTVTSTRPRSRRAGQRVRAPLRVVGGVHPHPGRLAVVEHRLVGGRVVGAGHRQPVAGHLAALVGPLLPGDVERRGPRRSPSVATTCTTAPAASRPRTFSAATAPAADHQHARARRPAGSPGTSGTSTGTRSARSVGEGDRRTAGLALLVEAQDLQLDGEVDLAERDLLGHRDHRGREVEDRRRRRRRRAGRRRPGPPTPAWR